MQQYLYVYGNVVDGFRFVGPFDSTAATEAYGEAEGCGDWWIAELDAPATGETP